MVILPKGILLLHQANRNTGQTRLDIHNARAIGSGFRINSPGHTHYSAQNYTYETTCCFYIYALFDLLLPFSPKPASHVNQQQKFRGIVT